MPVDRAEVSQPPYIEYLFAAERGLQPVAELAQHVADFVPERDVVQEALCGVLELVVGVGQANPVQHLRHRTARPVDRHRVVVEHHQELPLDQREVVHALERQAVDDAGIADNCNDPVVGSRVLLGPGQPGRRGDSRPGVPRGEDVILAFSRGWEPADAVLLAKVVEGGVAPGEYLVGVALVPHVPQQAIAREVEHVVQREGKFGHPEVARKVPARARDNVDDPLTQLVGQAGQFALAQPPQLVRCLYPVKKRIFAHGSSNVFARRAFRPTRQVLSRGRPAGPVRRRPGG